MPTSLPRLDSAKIIALDVETYDPGLQDGRAPAVRTGGYIAGLAVATDDRSWYFPMRHSVGKNFNPDVIERWAREELTREHQPKCGANLLYDLDYLAEAGVHVEGKMYDVQHAEPLIDENKRRYSLDSLGEQYLGEGKDDSVLYDWCHRAYGGAKGRKQAGNIWRAPAELVGPYAEQDVRLPLQIMRKQLVELERQDLMRVFDLEQRLVPMLLAMRRNGVRVNSARARELSAMLDERIKRDSARLNEIAGRKVNVYASADIVTLFMKLGLEYPKTKKGNASFTTDFLSNHDHEVGKLVTAVRKWEKFKGTFLSGYVDRYALNDRIYTQFHQLKGDKNGAVSGRFSSSDPNLQNIPSRDPEMGPLIRGLFVPEDGHDWLKIDYSQIEYRVLLHFATGEVADGIREQFHRDPKTDYHALVAEWAGIDRKPAKSLNFGIIYGMGLQTMCNNFGWTKEQATHFTEMYHEKIPFAKVLLAKAGKTAGDRGFVRTLLGRRARFDKYEPAEYGQWDALTLDEAKITYAGKRLRRAFTYSALNRVIQGTAADIMKLAMVKIWEAGLCDVTAPPMLTVHDELDFSLPRTTEAHDAAREIVHAMETAVDLSVPLVADAEIGPNWGDLSEKTFFSQTQKSA
jgi:DNA polymerase I-like protein with 3'-5' exonuclease and polymerase domains